MIYGSSWTAQSQRCTESSEDARQSWALELEYNIECLNAGRAVRKISWSTKAVLRPSFHSFFPQMRPLILLSFLLTILNLSVNAVIFPLDIRYGSLDSLTPRGSASTVQNVTSLSNVQYTTNITVAGVELTVSLDTGRFVKLVPMNQTLCSKLLTTVLIYG